MPQSTGLVSQYAVAPLDDLDHRPVRGRSAGAVDFHAEAEGNKQQTTNLAGYLGVDRGEEEADRDEADRDHRPMRGKHMVNVGHHARGPGGLSR